MNSRKKIFWPKQAAVAASVVIAVCLIGTIALKAVATPNPVVRLGYYNCDHMTAAPVAYDTGIFEHLGLKVEMTGNGKVPEAMAAGQMDVAYIGFSNMLQAIEKGSPMVVMAHNHMGGSMYMVVKNDIKKPADLIGKKLGIGPNPEKRHHPWIWFTKLSQIPTDSKHYEIFAMSDKDKYLAFKTGKLDGFFACDPWGSMAQYEKTGRILHVFGALPSGTWGICCTLVMNKAFVKDHPDMAVKMIQAHVQALQLIYMEPAKAARIFSKYYNVPEEVAMMTIYKKTVGESRTLRWKISQKGFAEETKHLVWLGMIDKAPQVEEIVNTALIKEANVPDFDMFIKQKVNPVFPLGMTYEKWKQKALEIDGKKA